jgi:tRNA/tmRNA/rRNA uracil-C5-methylase (TrmA/RlmC/RlmD family)
MQWATKVRGIGEALARAGVTPPGKCQEFAAEAPWSYRNRIQLRGRGDQVGYHARGSHQLVPITACDIAQPALLAQLPAIRERGRSLGRDYKVEIEALPDGSSRVVWDAPHGAAGFRQVNDAQNLRLRAWVTSAVRGSGVVFDLYGGDGNLTRDIASRVDHVEVVDLGAPRVDPPAKPAGLRYFRAAVVPWIQARAGQGADEKAASVIVDPPREGLGKDLPTLLASLARLGVTEAVVVGCDPDAWARDLKGWTTAGWRMTEFAALDFFPQTHHVEAVARLERAC